MKKLTLILMALALVFVNAACESQAHESQTETTTTEVTEEVTTNEEALEEESEPTEAETEDDQVEGEEEIEDTGDNVVEDNQDAEPVELGTNYKYLGEYELLPGTYIIQFGPRTDDFMGLAIVKADGLTEDSKEYLNELFLDDDRETIRQEQEITYEDEEVYTLEMGEHFGQFGLVITEAGKYLIGTETSLEDNGLVITSLEGNEIQGTEIK